MTATALAVRVADREGTDAAEEMDRVFRQADAKASAALTPEQLRQLCELLETVCGSLNGEGEK